MHILGERGLLVRVIIIWSLDAAKSILETEKTPKPSLLGKKKPKKPKKKPKTQNNPKKPIGLGFFKKTRVFSNPGGGGGSCAYFLFTLVDGFPLTLLIIATRCSVTFFLTKGSI